MRFPNSVDTSLHTECSHELPQWFYTSHISRLKRKHATLALLPQLPPLPCPTMQRSSLLSFTEMLMDTSNSYNFTSTSHDATGMPLLPHLDAALMASLQTHFGSTHTTGVLTGSDLLAFMRLHKLFQQWELQSWQLTLEHERLR